MKMQLTIYGLIFLLGITIGGGALWYIMDDIVDKAKLEAEQKFNDLLNQEKSKFTVKINDLQNSKEQLELLVSVTQNNIDSLNTAISKRNKELDKIKKDYNDKMSEIDGMSHNELTTFFSNRYRY